MSVAAEPDPPAPAYTFDNDDPVAAERLGLSSAVLDGFTISRLSSLGDLNGRRCLEVGAGNGSIAGWLADQAYETIIEQIVDARAVHLEWPWQVHAAWSARDWSTWIPPCMPAPGQVAAPAPYTTLPPSANCARGFSRRA